MWYGKGPGVDRCGDVFKHANFAGTSKHGGVLVLAGDDHAAKSSTLPHQSDHAFSAAMMPVIYPSSVQEILDLGLHGWAMSRYSGCWVGFKCVADTVESSSSVYVDPSRVNIVVPDDFPLPADGVSIRWPDAFLATEARMQDYKIYAALHYCRVNNLNRVVIDSPKPRLGIITSGKSYLDVRQALDDLGLDDHECAAMGIRVYKVGMPWPLEPEGVRHFAEGLEEILVVEEKRQIVEYQLKEQLYNWRDDVRPRVVGKFDEKGEWVRPHGDWLLPAASELTPAMIARVIAKRIERLGLTPNEDDKRKIRDRVNFINAKEAALAKPKIQIARIPYFCSGCPHNTSTKLPEGSRATAGIGCHVMAIWMDRATGEFTHMGGEGVPWIGQAPFTEEKHIFANLGDGTYYHSGILAIRACVAAKVNITFKILYNDAVAMTGGQPVDGPLTPQDIARQVAAEGRDEDRRRQRRARQVSVGLFRCVDPDPSSRRPGARAAATARDAGHDDPALRPDLRRRKAPPPQARQAGRPGQARRHQRARLRRLRRLRRQVELRVGAAGRDRVRTQAHDRPVVVQQGLLVPQRLLPELRDRRRRPVAQAEESGSRRLLERCPSPTRVDSAEPYGILITGIGGTGVITIGALLGMAAHLEGKGCSVLDMTGLAQKNGAVVSHVRIADTPERLYATRIAAGEADFVLACDILTGIGDEAIAKMQKGKTRALVNTALVMPASFTRTPDLKFPLGSMEQEIKDAVGPGDAEFLDATKLATGADGRFDRDEPVHGRLRLPARAVAALRSRDPEGRSSSTAPRSSRTSARSSGGRLAAVDPAKVASMAVTRELPESQRLSASLGESVARRAKFLTDYQDAAYAKRYADLVDQVKDAEAKVKPGSTALTEAVARYYFKLMAIKDEYEVARLYTQTDFVERVAAQFEGDYTLKFHLAPPIMAQTGSGHRRAAQARVRPVDAPKAFRVLAKLKGLRGTALDVFGKTAERRRERALIGEYETLIAELSGQARALTITRSPSTWRASPN